MDTDDQANFVIIISLVSVFSIGVLFLMFIASNGIFNLANQDKNISASYFSATGEATITFDFGEGRIRRFGGPIYDNNKVWDLFQQATAMGGINVKISDHFVPEVIGGYENQENGKQWNLYVNKIKQEFAPFKIQAKPGDEIVFKYE